ncbi:unnamed protein product [Fraxinus pennsylvanica]|uniref:AT-hook motif nuclear-localized protein n=1 Tax=Fraxinus pennsylvanica TaxID=56036 RepID=A0AAD1YZJ7_9LAMI|nr:unnamed protein product [Fraxinus pennsylvanica]
MFLNVASKIMAFSQQGPRTVCVLCANGAIRDVTLCQQAMSCGTVTYEGRFEIISDRQRHPVQVVVESFIADGKPPKSWPHSAPPPNMLNLGAPVTVGSPSLGASRDSSEENGGCSLNSGSEPYGNAGQPIQNISMYSNVGCPISCIKVHPN